MQAAVSHHENWSEHQTTMFSSLHEKQKLGKFCDVILKCHDSKRSFNAHSCVLSAASPVLDKLLQKAMDEKNNKSEPDVTPGKLVILLPEDVASPYMESLLNFIYSGNIDLSQKKVNMQEDTSPGTRKSKRNSLLMKTKSTEEATSSSVENSSSIEISSLYAFLKASRCLEIRTLTEHLESAVTLSEMKMSELANTGRSRRASITKQSVTRHPNEKDEKSIPHSPNYPENSKQTKTKKKRQMLESERSTNKNRNIKSPRKKGERDKMTLEENGKRDAQNRGVSKATEDGTEENEEVDTMLQRPQIAESKTSPDETVDRAPTDSAANSSVTCNQCEQRFRTKTALKRHACPPPTEEQANQVDSFPVRTRGNKKMQCPTCQKTFTSASVFEFHLKKHVLESKKIRPTSAETEVAESGESSASKKHSPKAENSGGNKLIEEAKQQELTDSPTLKRPKRASAIKFQNMMKTAFGAELAETNTFKTPKRKKTASVDSKSQKTKSPVKIFHDSPPHESEGAEGNFDPRTSGSVTKESSEAGERYTPLEKVNVAEMVTVESMPHEQAQPEERGIFPELHDDDRTQISLHEQEIMNTDECQPSEDEETDDSEPETSSRRKRKEVTDPTKPSGPVQCEICGKEAPNSKILMNHMRSHERPELPCEFCDQKFKYKSALTRHLQWHNGQGQSCHVCGLRLFSQRAMTQHMSTHNLKKMRTECPLCKKSFTSHYVMQLHYRTHTGEELFSCEICKKKFPYKSSLKMHMLLHTGEKPFICSVCGKCFVQKIHAREHELQHAGIRRFQCHLCERFFAHKCGLSRHIADIHHKSRPFVCETCGKSFPRKTKLVEHTRMHTGEKPYVCEICGVRYKANRSLKCHKKNRHNIFVPDYEVGIWRKGPLPAEEKKVLQRRKTKTVPSTFAFPVLSEPSEVPDMDNCGIKEEENIINNIAKEVDVISTEVPPQSSPNGSPASVGSKEDSPYHFNYQLQPANNDYQYAAIISESSSYQDTTLPPASTLTEISHATVMPVYPPQKTFIVPLNPNATTPIPVIAEQSQAIGPPGMMVTYMMPPQAIAERTELSPVCATENANNTTMSLHMARSASVPPMSTFRRNSTNVQDAALFQQTAGKPSLPGMHTFQPVQLHMAPSQLPHHTVTGFASVPAGVPVIVPATAVTQAADATEQIEETVVSSNAKEWQHQYSSENGR